MFALGLNRDKIINTFYSVNKYSYDNKNKKWVTDFLSENYKRPVKLSYDLIDAETNKKVLAKGEKLNIVIAKKLEEKKLKRILVSNEEIVGKYLSKEIKEKSGEILIKAGFNITEENLQKIISEEIQNLEIVNIDPINKGPYLLETLKVDKNNSKNDALNDIYKVLRPGEAPTIEIAEEVFKNLYFNKDRYDLSEVGRVKLNSKLNLDLKDNQTVLKTSDIIAIIKFMLDLRDGKGDVDDIDHLGNRRVRSVGELVENQFRIGLLRMERTVKEKMSTFLEIRVSHAPRFNQCKAHYYLLKRFFCYFTTFSIYGPNESII